MKKYERNIDERKKSFLIIHTNGMGDFLMFSPAYKEILKKYPNCEIDFFITNKNVKEIVSFYPNIKNIYVSSLKKIDLIMNLLKLRKKKYDISIVTTGGKTWKTNLFFLFLKSKLKIGEYLKIKSFIFDRAVKRREDSHFVENNIRLINSIFEVPKKTMYKLWFPLEHVNFIKNNEKIYIGIHPGSQLAYGDRRWDKFEILIEELLKKYSNINIKLFLGPEEKNIRKNFIHVNNRIKIIENKALKEVICELRECNIFINSDSGLGHLYTCFNTKIISIFGPNQLGLNQELRTGPYSTEAKIVKIRGMEEKYYKEKGLNKKYKCLLDIQVQDVLKEVDFFLCKEKLE